MTSEVVRIKSGDAFRIAFSILNDREGNLEGVELSTPDNRKHGFFLKDAHCPSKVRFSTFDELGMHKHYSADNYTDLVLEVVSYGFTVPNPGILNFLSSNPLFFQSVKSA